MRATDDRLPSSAGGGLPAPPSGLDPDRLSPGALAYVGDAVYTLLVRSLVVAAGPAKQRDLHARCVTAVRAEAQARSLAALDRDLTAGEREIVRRARNARIGKGGGGTPAERHHATALEALFGYLYLAGSLARLGELFTVLAASQEGLAGGEGDERPTA